MTSREMVQDSATRNQRTLADAVVATNRFRELDARFKSHDGMDLDPSTPEIESGYEFNRRSIEDDRAADDRNSISDQDITSGFVIRMKRFALALAACSSFSIDLALFFATSLIAFVPACTVSSTACVAPSVTAFVTVSAYLSPCSKLATILLRLF